MKKFSSIAISIGLILMGFILTAFIMQLFKSLADLGLLGSFSIGFAIGVIEVNVVKRRSDPIPSYYMLDNAIFPFISIGISAAIIVFSTNRFA